MGKITEDNRDIFEKALDVSPAIGSGIVGAVIGGKAARSLSKKYHAYKKEEHDNVFNGQNRDDRFSPENWISPEERSRVKRLYRQASDTMSASGLMGAAAGGAAGAATAGAMTNKKPRK